MRNKFVKFFRFIKNNILHFQIRIFKFTRLFFFPELWRFVPKRIMPSFEHLEVMKNLKNVNSLIDCGSNKGQFAILIYSLFKIKFYLSFDPIIFPHEVIKFLRYKKVWVNHESVALSSKVGESNFYITERQDSSSLKETIEDSKIYCPDVFHKETISVSVKTLDSFIDKINSLHGPIALKIDVQGSELELLLGSTKTLKKIDFLFIEISYESLYKNTYSNIEIFKLLSNKGFEVVSCYNYLIRRGKILSKDYLFKRI